MRCLRLIQGANLIRPVGGGSPGLGLGTAATSDGAWVPLRFHERF